MEGIEKHKSVLQISQTSTNLSRPIPAAPKGLCKNLKCIKKGLIIHYTNHYWIKYPELRQKYAFGHIQIRNLQKNLKAEKEIKTKSIPEIESWQPRILTVRIPKQSCWLVDSAADIHVCNNKRLIIDFTENPTKVGGLTSDCILPGRKKVKIRLALKDRIEGLVFILTNVFYLPNNSSKLISLGLLNNAGIYHHNKNQILYNLKTQKILAFTKRYKTSFLLHPLNLLVAVVNFLKNSKIYKKKTPNVNQTTDIKLFLIRWYQCLGHLNFILLRKYLVHYNIVSIDDTKDYMCNSCKKTKATKQYYQIFQQRAIKSY